MKNEINVQDHLVFTKARSYLENKFRLERSYGMQCLVLHEKHKQTNKNALVHPFCGFVQFAYLFWCLSFLFCFVPCLV